MLDLHERQIKVLHFILEQTLTSFTKKDLSPLGISDKTLMRDLKEMSELGLISMTYKTYTVNYQSPELCEFMILNDHTRAVIKKFYNFELLEQYIPNVTSWLNPSQLQALSAIEQESILVDEESYRKILNTLLIELSCASSRLENVHITLIETRTLLEYGEIPDGLNAHQLQIVLNHKKAIQYLLEHKNDILLNKYELCNIHSHLMNGLLSDPLGIGQIRNKMVMIDGSAYQPLGLSSQIEEQLEKILQIAGSIDNVHEQAFFLMVMLSYLQAFEDGNKRVSRLAMNLPYLSNNVIPFSFTHMKKAHYHLGLLMFYEYNRFDVLADVFVKSYLKGATHYKTLLNHVYHGGIIATLG